MKKLRVTINRLKKLIRSVPDFPKEGIMFRDITTLLKNPDALASVIDRLYEKYRYCKIDKVVAIDARGFILGGALAYRLHCGFVPARKPKKLPAKTVSQKYTLEYGEEELQIHIDGISDGDRVLIIDDLLATGGTSKATAMLVEQLGGKVITLAFVIELTFLNGQKALEGYKTFSLVKYDSE